MPRTPPTLVDSRDPRGALPTGPAPDSGDRRSAASSRRRALAVVVPLQLFLVAGWMRAGVEKLIEPRWWTGSELVDFLTEQRSEMLPWFVWLSDGVVQPIAPVVAWLVLWMQLGIAACLLCNRHVVPALWAGILLNVSFTMAGRVNPSAFYLVMQLALLFTLSRRVSEVVAWRRAAAWLVPAVVMAPFARTLHPREVIDDPALMLSFVCVLAAATTVAMWVPMERVLLIAERWVPGRSVVAGVRRLGERVADRSG